MYPINGGSATPQMFAILLINAMETAAAVPDRYSVVAAPCPSGADHLDRAAYDRRAELVRGTEAAGADELTIHVN